MRDEDESSSEDGQSQGASMMEPEHSVSPPSGFVIPPSFAEPGLLESESCQAVVSIVPLRRLTKLVQIKITNVAIPSDMLKSIVLRWHRRPTIFEQARQLENTLPTDLKYMRYGKVSRLETP